MSTFQRETPVACRIVATSADRTAAEQAVQQLHEEGFPLDTLAIEGHNIEEIQEAVGLVGRGYYIQTAALTGACIGAVVGISSGAALIALPVLGLVVAAGSLSATLLASVEGAAAGTLLGTLVGALLGWMVPRRRGIRYDIQVKSGQFLVIVRSTAGTIARARSLLASKGPALIEVYEPQHQES